MAEITQRVMVVEAIANVKLDCSVLEMLVSGSSITNRWFSEPTSLTLSYLTLGLGLKTHT